MSEPIRVAVLGLGAMGHAFARNLLKQGFAVQIWNRTASRGDDLVAEGASRAETPAEAVRDAAVVLTMLPDAATTAAVLFEEGALAAMAGQATLLQMGTLGVEPTLDLIARIAAARADVVFIDAPVSGTKKPAEEAQVLVLASGDRDRSPHIDAVFAAISKGARWLGPAGAGSRMKLVVNSWLIMMMQGIAESSLLAEKLGFSPEDLWGVLDGGPLAAPYVKGKLDMIGRDDFTAQMALEWGLKDARLALDAGEGLALPGLAQVAETWAEADAQGLGQQDIASVYRHLQA